MEDTLNVNGVVEITTSAMSQSQSPFRLGGSQTSSAFSTGFVYGTNGDIVTNEHVIAGADSITVKLADGSSYQATVVGSDASKDVAVLHIDAPASKLHPLTLADSSLVQVGDAAVAIGDQYGLVDSLTTGVVSALGRTITSPDGSSFKAAIQTDAAINEGSSGGPLLSDQGDVIGVTSQIASSSGGSIGIGYAIPSNTVKTVADGLIAGA